MSGAPSDEDLVRQEFRHRRSNAANLTELPDFGPDSLARDGIVDIRLVRPDDTPPAFVIVLNGPAFVTDRTKPSPRAVIPFDDVALHELVQRCRDTWYAAVIDRKWRETGGWLNGLFKDRWFQAKIHQQAETLAAVGPEIANAGAELFAAIFDKGGADLANVAALLRDASARQDLTLTVYSDDCFVPWGMLYTGAPDTCDKHGFWGYRHIIEHSLDAFHPTVRLTVEDDKLQLGYCYDPPLARWVTAHVTALKTATNLRVVPRADYDTVRQAFQTVPYPDGLTHFYAHCKAAGRLGAQTIESPHIEIAGRPIRASDVMTWAPGKLGSQPFFLLSACEGGQLQTRFYASFTKPLLQREAKGLLGPQVEVPMVFAIDYAKRFLDALVTPRDGRPARIGEIVRQLARQYWDAHNNPLGLIYSLYRGADCFAAFGPKAP
jgi:hypothetical protein